MPAKMTANTKPSVSVIIPTYNRATLIKRSIQSVLKQTFDDFEVIVVDDASSDNTEEVIASLQDVRIRYFRHESNRGGSAARNTGIEKAQGDLIAFQDSDDEWLPDKLEKQVKTIQQADPSVGLVYTGFWRIQGDTKEYLPGPHIKKTEGDIHQELLKGNFITTQAVLVKKECFQKVGGFDDSLPRFQDWELFLRIAKHYEFRYIAEPLVISYFTEGSISSKPQAMIEAFEIILDKHIDDYRLHKTLYATMLSNLANLYRQDKNVKKTRQYLLKSFLISRRPGILVAILSTFLGIRLHNLYWEYIGKVLGTKTKS